MTNACHGHWNTDLASVRSDVPGFRRPRLLHKDDNNYFYSIIPGSHYPLHCSGIRCTMGSSGILRFCAGWGSDLTRLTEDPNAPCDVAALYLPVEPTTTATDGEE